MASFEKLAGKSTRANMKQQIEELDLEPKKAKPKTEKDDVNKPGSKKYLERRQKDYETHDKE